MFKLLGSLLAVYAFYALVQGEVYAKSGAWGRTVRKAESPGYFHTVLAIYFLLAAALIFVF